MAATYEQLRQKNIEANRALLESLGLNELKNFAPAAISNPTPNPNPKHQTKSKQQDKKLKNNKRKWDEEEEGSPDVNSTKKFTRVDGPPGTRRSSRISTLSGKVVTINYNEDSLAEVSGNGRKPKTLKREHDLPADRDGRVGNRLGERKHDPKVFGAIPGVEPGTWWATRAECSTDAIHAPFVAGIAGNKDVGTYSVALSGGYDDDVDLGYAFTYTGCGGRDLKGTKEKPKNLRTAPQSSDQSFENPLNKALQKSSETRKPVRVIRGFKLKSIYAPKTGYRYDGLYIVEKAWTSGGSNSNGFLVCRYAFKRLPNQPEIPTHSLDSDSEDSEHQEDSDNNEAQTEGTSEKNSPPPPTEDDGEASEQTD